MLPKKPPIYGRPRKPRKKKPKVKKVGSRFANRDFTYLGMASRVNNANGYVSVLSNGIQVRDYFAFTGGMTPSDHVNPTPLTWRKTLERGFRGSVSIMDRNWEWMTDTGYVSYHTGRFTAPLPTLSGGTRNRALSKLWDKVYNSDLNLATTIGEWKASRDAVLGAAVSIGKIISLARTCRRDPISFAKKWGATKRELRDIRRNPSHAAASAWLSAKYGWIPMYQDVYGLLTHVSSKLSKAEGFHAVSGVATVRESLDQVIWQGTTPMRFTRKGESFLSHKIGVRFRVSNPSLFELQRVTTLNPASVAWELTPLSFVVDWFVDVGGCLELAERALLNGLQFHSGYERTYSEVKLVSTGTSVGTPSANVWYRSAGSAWYIDQSYDRSLLSTWPFPSAPSLNLKLGAQRVLSAASLLRTILLPRKI